MNSRARQSLRAAEDAQVDSEHTAHISHEKIAKLKAACVDDASTSQPSSLSGMVAPVVQAAEQEGPFTTVCEIASGSTAMVYLAVDNRTDAAERVVAVKHYLPRITERRDFADQFIQELSLARAVNHPCVCKLLDYGRAGSSYYTATEFLQGEPLSNVLTAPGMRGLRQRAPRLIAHLIANLAEGLHAVHTLNGPSGPIGAAHEDVTASNLFVLYDGHLRVANFGTAWIRDLIGQKHTASDKSYLAPEQLERGTLDARVDVWALGVVLWELLAGKKLFRGTTKREAVVEITARRISPPSEHNAQVSAELDRIVLKALARNRNKRYGSARELSFDLEQYLAQSGGSVAPTEVAEWLKELFPNGPDRVRGMLELAATARSRLPRFPDTDDAASPMSSPYTPAAQDEGEHTTHIYAPKLDKATLRSMDSPIETVSFKDIPTTLRRPKRNVSRPWRTTLLPFGAAFATVLLCFLAGHAVFSRAYAGGAAQSTPAPAAQLDRPLSAPLVHLSAATVAPKPVAPPVDPIPAAATPIAATPVAAIPIAATPIAPEPIDLDPLPVAPLPAPTASVTPLKRNSAASTATSAAISATARSGSSIPAKPTAAKPVSVVSTTSTIPTQPGAVYLTTPGGGDVYDRGRLLGHAPAEFELSPGWHTLVVKSGAENRTVTVQVPAGSAIMVSVPASKP